MQSGFDINHLQQEAQSRWLKPPEVLFILQNHEKYRIDEHAPQMPPSGSLFLFNKRVLRFFRKDGHSWRKKKDGRNVGEAHERLKVGTAEALNCYYAHGEDNPNFQRRCYWMLDREYEHIVLVHYREITEGKASPGFSQSPSARNQDSCSLTSVHDSYQSYSSPGSTEVNSERMDYFSNHSVGAEDLSVSSNVKVNEALRRLEVQLSLDDDSFKDYAPLDNQDGNEDGQRMLDDLLDSTYAGNCFSSDGLSLQHDSAFDLGNGGVTDLDIAASFARIYNSAPEQPTMLLGASLGPQIDSTLTVAKEQRFTIRDVSPQWGYSGDYTKIIIVGSFLCEPAEHAWYCMFGETEVPLQVIQNGVLCCNAPPQSSGKVTLCITSGNREACSEIREFEYRDKYTACTNCNKQKVGEIAKSTEELLLLVRFVQLLLSNASVRHGENNEAGGGLLRKQKNDEYSWGQIIEALLVGGGTTTGTLDWLLQNLLKDKLQQWLASRSPKSNTNVDCSLSKKEQGVIHMIAGLGYEWALSPILACRVGINFRDINGWTALHWAARFGREKMVAALIASGASAVAVTDPSAQDPIGRMPAYIAASNGHKGLAAYLSELALTNHLSSLKLQESELSKGFADVEAESAINSIQKASFTPSEDQLSLRHTLGAVRNAAHAAARIQAAFRAHSFRKRMQNEAATAGVYGVVDEYGFTANDIQGLSAASKLAFRGAYDHNKAALSIQKNYRSWKGRKDFLTLRQKVVKIQAHVRGYQARKKHICWAVGILDKAVLRWRRKGAGLRGYKPESDSMNEEENDEDIVKAFRKERVNAAIDEAVSTVRSLVDSAEARQQYNRMLGKYQEAKAELQGQGATIFAQGMDDKDIIRFA